MALGLRSSQRVADQRAGGVVWGDEVGPGADHQAGMGEGIALVAHLAQHERAIGPVAQRAEMRGKAGDKGQKPGLGVAGKGDAADAGGAGVGVGPGQRGVAEGEKRLGEGAGLGIGGLDGVGAAGSVRSWHPWRLTRGRAGESSGNRPALTCQ